MTLIKGIPLWAQVLIALALGVLFGFTADSIVSFVYGPVENWTENLKWIGELFIRLIKMVIAPLVFFSIVSGIISLGDPKALGRVGLKTILAYLCTTTFAIIFALLVANLFNPGYGLSESLMSYLETQETTAADPNKVPPTVIEILMGIVPHNALESLINQQMLQIIFFAVFVGVVMVIYSNETPQMHDLVHEAALVFNKLITAIIYLAPYAVFALTAWVVGALGMDAITGLGSLVVTVTAALLLHMGLLFLALFVIGRLSPFPFMRKALTFQIMAFSTSSSSATMPTTMQVLTDRIGVSKPTTSMVIPLGATINMDGTAMYLAISAVFVAQIFGIDLSMADYTTIVLTVVLMSVGTAAIPGGSIVMMPIVFASVGLPESAIALILGVDRLLDMLRTTINVTGDAVVATLIDRSEKTFDEALYYDNAKPDLIEKT